MKKCELPVLPNLKKITLEEALNNLKQSIIDKVYMFDGDNGSYDLIINQTEIYNYIKEALKETNNVL